MANWCDAGLVLNRCFALYLPHHYRRVSSHGVSLSMIVAYWVLAIAFVLPISLGVDGSGLMQSPIGVCSVSQRSVLGQVPSVILSYLPYSITGSGVILILGKSIVMARNQRRKVQLQSSSGRRDSALRRRLNVSRMLALTFLWMAACAVPGYVILLQFPYLLRTNPVSILWIKTCAVCQFCFTPVGPSLPRAVP